MKKTTILITCLLVVIGVLIYGFFIHNNLKKKYTRYLDHVQSRVDMTSYELVSMYQNNNRILNDYCKSDSTPEITKDDFYRSMAAETRSRESGRQLFGLLTDLHYSVKNRDEVYKIRDEYDDLFQDLWTFYLTHHHFSEIKEGEIDQLISYNNKLASCVERLQKIKIEL